MLTGRGASELRIQRSTIKLFHLADLLKLFEQMKTITILLYPPFTLEFPLFQFSLALHCNTYFCLLL
jgi:hypothetical protein